MAKTRDNYQIAGQTVEGIDLSSLEKRRQHKREYAKKRYAENPEAMRAYKRKWIAENPDAAERARARHRAWYVAKRMADPGFHRERSRKNRAANPERYRKVARERYRALRNTGRLADLPAPTRPIPAVCECCGGPPGKNSLCLDHSHKTRKFRGWLCVKCNSGIGKLGDSVAGLQRAIDYLRRVDGKE